MSEARLAVRLTPRGGRDAIEGWVQDEAGRPVLKARVAAAAADGNANSALIRLLADRLGLAPSRLRIASGATSRRKLVVIDGVEPAAVAAALQAPQDG